MRKTTVEITCDLCGGKTNPRPVADTGVDVCDECRNPPLGHVVALVALIEAIEERAAARRDLAGASQVSEAYWQQMRQGASTRR